MVGKRERKIFLAPQRIIDYISFLDIIGFRMIKVCAGEKPEFSAARNFAFERIDSAQDEANKIL